MVSALIALALLAQVHPELLPPATRRAETADVVAPIIDASAIRPSPTSVPDEADNRAKKTAVLPPSSAGIRVRPVANRKSSARSLANVTSAVSGAPDTVVVVPRIFLQTLQPWLDHRTAQGHQLVIVDSDGGPRSIRNVIRQAARAGQLKYVVLVGDAEPSAHLDPLAQARSVPTFLREARVNIKWGSEPEIATDSPYTDLDGDGVPEMAIGRIPANSNGELRRFIQKVLAYERQPRVGAWQNKVNFVAGVGDFGAIADAMIEATCKKIITQGIRPEYDISMTYGSWRSPYCPAPRQFRDITINRLNEGSLFWVYMGHGRLDSLDEIRLPNQDTSLPIFERQDIIRLNCRWGHPIALMLACYTGAFDHSQECLGEEMLMSPSGPVAVIAGSRVTMPYAMAIMGAGMLESFFDGKCTTVGDLLLQGKQHLARGQSDKVINRKLLDSLARTIHAHKDDVAAERLEHILLFNLLGDPLLRIPKPKKVRVTAPGRVTGGKTILVKGTAPISGTATIELVCRRDRMRMRTSRRIRYDDSEGALARMNQVYRFANDKRWNSVQTEVDEGRFLARLHVPDNAQGHSHVRVAVQDSRDFAVGTHDIYIQPPKNLAEAAK